MVESVELVVAPLPPASDAVFELSPSLVLPTVAFIAVATLLSAMGVDIGLARPGRCERARRVTAEEAAAAARWCDELLDGDSSCLLAEISMATGAKREVRRILRAAGFETQRLVRLAVRPELHLRKNVQNARRIFQDLRTS